MSGDSIARIEREIGEIKSALGKLNELEGVIEEIKRGLMDLRATLNEVENPFNLLRFITSEEDLARVNETKPVLEKIVKEKGVPQEPATPPKGGEKEEREAKTAIEEHTKEANYIERPHVTYKKDFTGLDFRRTLEIIEWIYSMLDMGFDEDSIRSICQYSEFFNLLPRGSAQYISSLSSVVKRAKSNNITEDALILGMYGLANIMNLTLDRSEIIGLIRSLLRNRRFNGECFKAWASQ